MLRIHARFIAVEGSIGWPPGDSDMNVISREELEKPAKKSRLDSALHHQFCTKVPFRRSVIACIISASVFITNGP